MCDLFFCGTGKCVGFRGDADNVEMRKRVAHIQKDQKSKSTFPRHDPSLAPFYERRVTSQRKEVSSVKTGRGWGTAGYGQKAGMRMSLCRNCKAAEVPKHGVIKPKMSRTIPVSHKVYGDLLEAARRDSSPPARYILHILSPPQGTYLTALSDITEDTHPLPLELRNNASKL
jgi:hypothetical protein